MKKGVYLIENKLNGKVYIGSSVDVIKRWGDHKRDLNNGNHHCISLQRAWNKYGEESFEFKTIRRTKGDQRKIEQELLNSYFNNWTECYNSNRNANGGNGDTNIPIFQIRDNEIVGYYVSSKSVQRESNNYFRQGQISKSVASKKKEMYGFDWVNANLFPNVKEREDYLNGYRDYFAKPERNNNQSIPIIAINIKTKKETFFESIKKAKEVLNIDFRPITRGIRNEVKGYTCKTA